MNDALPSLHPSFAMADNVAAPMRLPIIYPHHLLTPDCFTTRTALLLVAMCLMSDYVATTSYIMPLFAYALPAMTGKGAETRSRVGVMKYEQAI